MSVAIAKRTKQSSSARWSSSGLPTPSQSSTPSQSPATSGRELGGGQVMNQQSIFLQRSDIAPVLNELQALEGLSEWADEDDEPIALTTVTRARKIIERLASESYFIGATWRKPKVAPTPDGAIHMFWRAGTKTLTVNVNPVAPYFTFILMKETGDIQELSLSDDATVSHAMQFLMNAPLR